MESSGWGGWRRPTSRSIGGVARAASQWRPSVGVSVSTTVCLPAWLVFARDDNGFVAMTRLRPSAPRKLTGNAGWLTQTARAPLPSAVRLHAGLARAGRGLYSARLRQDV